MNIIQFPPPLEDEFDQALRRFREHPQRFRNVGQKPLKVEGRTKTETIYRWLRVGRPKSVHLMAHSLDITYEAVRAIINDLRAKGADIVSEGKWGGDRHYKMLDGPHTYDTLKRKCGRR